MRGNALARYGKRTIARMLIPRPQGWLRGTARARSSRRTGRPAAASVRAAVAPAGPPPTTRMGDGGEEKAITRPNREKVGLYRPVGLRGRLGCGIVLLVSHE